MQKNPNSDLQTNQALENYQEAVEKDFKRNLTAIVGLDGFFALGISFALLSTVMPAYFIVLGAPKVLIGTMQVLLLNGPLQLLASKLVRGPNRKYRCAGAWFVYAMTWLVFGIVSLLWYEKFSSIFWIGAFTITCAAGIFCVAIGDPSFVEITLSNVPLRRRGGIASIRSISLAVMGILGTTVALKLMGRMSTPKNYHVCFVVAGLAYTCGTSSILFIRDHISPLYESSANSESVLMQIKRLWSNMNYRVFIFFQACFVASITLGPFIVAYSREYIGMPANEVSWFSMVYISGVVLAGFLVIPWADKHGFRLVGILQSLVLACAFFVPLLFPSRIGAIAGYACFAAALMAGIYTVANLSSEIFPDIRPSRLIALASLSVLPFTACTAPLSGLIIDHFGKQGYIAVLIIGALLAVVSALGFTLLVREPRKGEHLILRIVRRP